MLHQYVKVLDLQMEETHLLLETRDRNQVDSGKAKMKRATIYGTSPPGHICFTYVVSLHLDDNVVRQLLMKPFPGVETSLVRSGNMSKVPQLPSGRIRIQI